MESIRWSDTDGSECADILVMDKRIIMEPAIEFKTIFLPINQGHGRARREALQHCTYSMVAWMDADDISRDQRFERQLAAFMLHNKVDIVGGQISEFILSPQKSIGIRRVPEKHKDIIHFMKKRCPMNQVSVMVRKEAVYRSGGYQDWYCEEDYYLWLRMAKHHCKFMNIPDILVDVRVGDDMSERRGGWKYFSSESRLQAWMLNHGMIHLGQYICNILVRFVGEVVMPVRGRTWLYHITRDKKMPSSVANEKKKEEKKLENYPPFSVAMCVYGKDNPEWFDRALQSITVDQTVKPSEIVLVVDGPVPDKIKHVIQKYTEICNRGGVQCKLIWFQENRGLGKALKSAVEECSHKLVARMDSDDISVSDRFQKQLDFLRIHKDISIVGGQIEEFISEGSKSSGCSQLCDNCYRDQISRPLGRCRLDAWLPAAGFLTNTDNSIIGKRMVPCTDDKIKKFMKKRCPLNHMTVMFRRADILAAGNYRHWMWNEDYDLWIRLADKGFLFANMPDTLTFVRVGEDMYRRRGGIKYFRSEMKIQKALLDKKLIGLSRYGINVCVRLIVQVIMPNFMREMVFRVFARTRGTKE